MVAYTIIKQSPRYFKPYNKSMISAKGYSYTCVQYVPQIILNHNVSVTILIK